MKRNDETFYGALYKGYVYFRTTKNEEEDAVRVFKETCRDLHIGIGKVPFYDLRPEDKELFVDGEFLAFSFEGDSAFRSACEGRGINTDNLYITSIYEAP